MGGAPQDGRVRSSGVRRTGRRPLARPASVFELEPIGCSGSDSGSRGNPNVLEPPRSSLRPAAGDNLPGRHMYF